MVNEKILNNVQSIWFEELLEREVLLPLPSIGQVVRNERQGSRAPIREAYN
jgi:hypothetical protein